MKFSSQFFSNADDSLKDNASATTLRWFASDTENIVFIYTNCGEDSAHLHGKEQSFLKVSND